MKKEDIHLWDVKRILFGEAPAEFMVEVFFRTLFIYIVLMVTVRMMGKRLSGQLTISEMAVMVTLGAIVSPAMQTPNNGLLQGVLILACALVFQRGLNYLEFKNRKLERLDHGELRMVVKDGEILLNEINRSKLSRQQLFAALRSRSIYNLGQVERMYVESFGLFSVYKLEPPVAGLSLLPPGDDEVQEIQVPVHNRVVCTSCGHVRDDAGDADSCPLCTSDNRVPAMIYS
ncbi:DUF421 domain-containing protein [Dyadobacter sandarakinus]|uniref:DUF421 domain-containing protein n=1 Tax=Dyadobacter sandarakinus TaxID=2747268 RepID=A0ABX7I3A6_9BACT|nr:YetF domain-containing protein [Dyadobacter sandarakinus]QRR00314.1 DUF421 domain-containing protein [Dyadobacter sandarakinus]